MSLLIPERPTNFDELKARIAGAKSIVAVTGAGISASTGIATYRDRGSKWTNESLGQKMHASRYGNHLPEIWEFWGDLRKQSLSVNPTPAHMALNDRRVVVLTQNIDGLHARAGNQTVELHGNVLTTRCIRCKSTYIDSDIPNPGEVPDCKKCGYKKRTRVDVVLFGEELKSKHIKFAVEKLKSCDVCIYIGTSGNVFPAADFIQAAGRAGAATALINKDAWQPPFGAQFDVTLLGDSDDLVPELFA